MTENTERLLKPKFKRLNLIAVPFIKVIMGLLLLIAPLFLFIYVLKWSATLPTTWLYHGFRVDIQGIIILFCAIFISLWIVRLHHYVVRALKLNPKQNWIIFLQRIRLKIWYYKKLSTFLKIWNLIIIIPVLFLVPIVIILLAAFAYILINTDFQSITFLLSSETITTYESVMRNISSNKIVVTSIEWMIKLIIIYLGIGILGVFTFSLLLPTNKHTKEFDTTDIPVSFIKNAIYELEEYNFESNWDDQQRSKLKVIQNIAEAMDFLTLEYKVYGIPFSIRYFSILVGDITNKNITMDIAQRLHGFNNRLEKILVKLNCMKEDDRDDILQNLKESINILENKNICEMEEKEIGYETSLKDKYKLFLSPFMKLLSIL